MLIRILCLLSFCVPAICFAQIKDIYFFNVGQGNCTLVRFKEGPPLLVDAGSSWYPGETENQKNKFRKERQEEISELIENSLDLEDSNPFALNVVVSHGDVDHYSWLFDIFERLNPEKDILAVKAHFLLGGQESDYGDKFRKSILRFAHDNQLHYSSKYPSLEEIPPPQCIGATCTILAAERTKDKNTNSLVLKIEDSPDSSSSSSTSSASSPHSSAFSVILTGDATGATTRGILERYEGKLDFLRTHVLQASHHGADSDESNNAAWIAATQPSSVVISAGERLDYLHPRQGAIKSFFQPHQHPLHSLSIPHFLHYTPPPAFTDYHLMLDRPFSFARLDTGYAVALTNTNVFNTFDQGNINFNSEAKQWTFEKHPRRKDTTKLSALSEFVQYFTLSPEAAHTIGFVAPEGPMTQKFIESLRSMEQLVSCDLHRGRIDTEDGLSELEKFIRMSKVSPIFSPQFGSSLEKESSKQRLRNAWGHKGLFFSLDV
jgi:beta-lactamase superfamily II metal-dependent hydrolase